MNYEQTLRYLFSSTPAFHQVGALAYKEGLENTLALDQYFGHPHQKYSTIHVAGTNGKGSTSCLLAAYLQKLGLRVGLYTSPHIYDFRERIRVNGVKISEEYVVGFVAEHRHFFEPLNPSFFEVTTAMAFKYFADQQVDIAVIEVGLGGRLDCTNIIRPLLSIITNISLDHTNLLGTTLTEIAREKAGIIKRSVPVVIGESREETLPVFAMRASQENAELILAEKEVETFWKTLNGSEVLPNTFEELVDSCALKGAYQYYNIRTAFAAVLHFEDIGLKTDFQLFKQALQDFPQLTGLQGRWQEINSCPKTIIDTGHNAAGWEYLGKQLNGVIEKLNTLTSDRLSTRETAAGKQTPRRQPLQSSQDSSVPSLRIVFGMVDDKDLDAVIRCLPVRARYYFAQADTHRAVAATKIQQIGYAYGLRGSAFATGQAAYDAAVRESSENDIVFIGGSNYLVGDIVPLSEE